MTGARLSAVAAYLTFCVLVGLAGGIVGSVLISAAFAMVSR